MNEKPCQAILSLTKDIGQKWGQWILLDTKGHPIDDFEWQAQELAFNWNLPEGFEWECEEEVTKANKERVINTALQAYAHWLGTYHFTLITLSNEKHLVCGAFILPTVEMKPFQALAKELELTYKVVTVG
ncbi:DUF6630 family protein [Hydromonas duriensis]|nr:hypothetical protein [Hydromonas duriensis]